MKGHNFLPLAVSLVFLSGCQQLNDDVNTVNGEISSSLSSVGKALGGTASTQSIGPESPVSGLGPVCKDYEENAMAAEKNGRANGSQSQMRLFLKLRRAEVPAI